MRAVPLFTSLVLAVPLVAQTANPATSQQTAPPPTDAPANPAPQNPEPQNPKPIGAAGQNGGGAAVDPNTYKIGPSDVLFIRVWNEGEFTGPVTVHQDGKFTLPLLGDLEAEDKTPKEVQDIVANALKKMVVRPLVTVTVQEVGSKRYYLDGMVNHPGEFALIAPTTVFEALSRAGGIGEFANSRKIYVLRGDRRIPFNYKEVLKGKNLAQNIQLKPGDHVVVP